jgi:hypothetical protein
MASARFPPLDSAAPGTAIGPPRQQSLVPGDHSALREAHLELPDHLREARGDEAIAAMAAGLDQSTAVDHSGWPLPCSPRSHEGLPSRSAASRISSPSHICPAPPTPRRGAPLHGLRSALGEYANRAGRAAARCRPCPRGRSELCRSTTNRMGRCWCRRTGSVLGYLGWKTLRCMTSTRSCATSSV